MLCQISEGRTGACDRYANADGRLIRVDPVVFLSRTDDADADQANAAIEFGTSPAADQSTVEPALFVTGVGASSTYPDYKPAPFIVASKLDDVDMDVVFAYADRMIVLARGKLIAEGDADTIRNDARVQEVYFGTGKTFRPHAPLQDASGGARDRGALQ